MILSEKNLDIWYKDYLKKFKNVSKFITRKGGTPQSTKPMSRGDFKTDFISMTSDHPNINGKKIAETMAQQELYSKSYAQSKKLAEAEFKMTGQKPKNIMEVILQYRMDKRQNIWSNIKSTRILMKSQGFTNESITSFISQEFFGSQ